MSPVVPHTVNRPDTGPGCSTLRPTRGIALDSDCVFAIRSRHAMRPASYPPSLCGPDRRRSSCTGCITDEPLLPDQREPPGAPARLLPWWAGRTSLHGPYPARSRLHRARWRGGMAMTAPGSWSYDTLTPATREDSLFALDYSLRFGLTGKPHKATDSGRVAAIQLAAPKR
jgi:hypothetical protein